METIGPNLSIQDGLEGLKLVGEEKEMGFSEEIGEVIKDVQGSM